VENKLCRVCNSPDLEFFLDLGEQPHGDSFLSEDMLSNQEPTYPLKTCFCRSCATVQINYTVPKEEMFEHYLYVSGTTRTLKKHFQDTTNALIKFLSLSKGDFVVDIGSNDGTWLETYAGTGIKTLGIDGAKNLAEVANKKGIETWPVFFDEEIADKIIEEYGEANLVTAAGVFFHLEELHSVTAGIAKLIGSSGTFCIQAIYLGGMIGENKFDQIYHEHLTYWTLTTVQKLLEMHKLEIYDAKFIPVHGGSIEILAAKKHTKVVNQNVKKILQEEINKGLSKIQTYQAFAQRVWAIKDDLLRVLDGLVKNNKIVFALGAPIKGSTLLNSFKIGPDLVTCALEINPLKIGKYIPGVRIPIVDEADCILPDVYLALAWNFLPELINKNLKFLEKGGEILVPIPSPFFINKSNYVKYIT
jgi:2-polyprenyl-3-methyl-5-hydroxy-6-metoxy-1,4-benzoquinol methylase